MSALLALADRCEREEPSRALSVEIWMVAMTGVDSSEWVTWEDFTSSIDAAVTLVPEGWVYRCGSWTMESQYWAELNQPMHGWTLESDKKAKSIALALCAAALRARAAVTP